MKFTATTMTALSYKTILILSCIQLIALAQQNVNASRVVYNPMTISEWSQRFQCDGNETREANCQRFEPSKDNYCSREADVCSRTSTDWMRKYVDELDPKFNVLIKEKSIDERLANIVYAMVTTRGLDTHFSLARANSPEETSRLAKLLVGPQVNDTLCGQQLQQMLALSNEMATQVISKADQPLEESHIRLARVLDSFGRYESGYLSGRYQTFGDYDQCINSQLELNKQLVGMRYCWAHLDMEENLSPQLRDRKRYPHEKNGGTVLSTGVCLPESCHSASLESHSHAVQQIVDGQFRFPSSIYRKQTLNVAMLECVADTQSPIGIPTGGKILLSVLAGWICLTAFATYRCSRRSDTNKGDNNDWLQCISLSHSWNEFIEADESDLKFADDHVCLDLLNPIKIISMLMFTSAHGVVTQSMMSNALLRDAKVLDLDTVLQVIFALPMVVESFFVLTGVLVAYIALKKHKSTARKENAPKQIGSFIIDCFRLIISRYLRIYPLFYLIFAIKKGVYVFLGSGPTWNYGLNQKMYAQCQDIDWLGPLRLISYTYNMNNERNCLPQTYTITCDLIFVLLMAPLIYSINKLPKTSIGVALLCTLWSTVAGMTAINSLDRSMLWPLADKKTSGILQVFASRFGDLYMSPDYRLGSAFFGVIAGYFIFRYDEMGQVEQKYCPNWLLTALTWFSGAYVFIILTGGALKNHTPVSSRLEPDNLVIVRMLWALSTAVILVRLVTDWNHTKNVAWMRAKPWKILAKLNYSILLIHFDLLQLDWNMQISESHLSKYNVLKTFIFAYVCSIGLGVVLYVLIENPINKLAKKCFAPM